MTHPKVSPQQAAELMREQGYAYLDVRSEAEFGTEHALAAYNVPINQPQGGENPDFIAIVRASFPLDAGLVIGCRSGTRSRTAAERLVQAGFSHVVEQAAGHEGRRDPFGRASEPGWRAAGLPCATEPMPGHEYAALRAKRADRNKG